MKFRQTSLPGRKVSIFWSGFTVFFQCKFAKKLKVGEGIFWSVVPVGQGVNFFEIYDSSTLYCPMSWSYMGLLIFFHMANAPCEDF